MAFLNPETLVKQLPLEEGLFVADLGAGGGAFSIPIAKRIGKSGRIFAIDVNQELLGKILADARKIGLSNVEVVWSDVEKPEGSDLKEGIIDLVIISNLFFLVLSKEAIMNETKRILKPRGYVLVVDWQESFGGTGPKEEDIVDKESVKKLFLNSGFALYNELDAGSYHYALLFKKL